MRTNPLTAGLFAGLLLLAACSSKKDSLSETEKANEAIVEKAKPEQAETMASDSKSNQKDVAEYMATLANSNLTELEMSKLALQRTSSAAVRQFARQLIEQNTISRQMLRAQAKQYRVLLPTTLSNDSQAMVKQLRGEPNGPDFDRRYLNRMAQLNDEAASKAKNLIRNTDKPALANFIQNLIATNEQNMDKATELRGTIK